ALFPRMFRLFQELKPAIVHTRNLAALEMAVPAWAAGVPARIHGEHGWDVSDLQGSSRRHQWIRRAYRPFVSNYIAVSRDLERYLVERVGLPRNRVSQIYNGVDTRQFHPAARREPVGDCPFRDPSFLVIGTVGRMVAVKNPLALAEAFVRMRQMAP